VLLLERMGAAQDEVTAAGLALEAGRKAVTAELQAQVDDAQASSPPTDA
jgi:thiazole synthase ThiGH ThiG subunit